MSSSSAPERETPETDAPTAALETESEHRASHFVHLPFFAGRHPGESKLEYIGHRAWAIVGIGIVAWGLLKLLAQLGVILIPLVIGAVIVVLCSPVVEWFEKRKVNRILGTLICYLIAAALLAGLVILIVPAFTSQVRLLSEQAPGYVERSTRSLESFQDRMDDSYPQLGDAMRQGRQSFQTKIADLSGEAVGTVFSIVSAILGFLAAFFIAAIVSFLILVDLPRLKSGPSKWLNRPRNRRLAGALKAMSHSGVWFVRGQLITGIVTGALVSLSLWILHVPFFLPLGALAGIFHVIPGIGPFIAAIPTVLIAFISGGWLKALAVTAVTILILQGVAYLLAPRILGKVVNLHPVTVIVALTVGGALFGIAGVLLAVPIVAAARDGIRWAMYTPEEVEAAYAEGPPSGDEG